MKNISLNIDGDTLTLKIDLSKDYGPSISTGKTIIVATTSGNIPIPELEDYGFRLGLTLYRYPGAIKKYVSQVPKAKKRKRLSLRGQLYGNTEED